MILPSMGACGLCKQRNKIEFRTLIFNRADLKLRKIKIFKILSKFEDSMKSSIFEMGLVVLEKIGFEKIGSYKTGQPKSNSSSYFQKNKTGTDGFQDCCKKWTLNPGICYFGFKQ